MTAIEKEIQELQDKAVQVAELKEDVFQETAEIGIEGLGIALRTLKEGFDTWFEGMASTEYYDAKLGDKLQSAISEAITKFTQVKHEINFAPNINLDFKPIEAELSRSTAQGKLLHGLMEKFSSGTGKQEELFKLITVIGEKQILAFEKISGMADIRPELEKINTTLDKPKPTKWKGKVTKRIVNQGNLNGLLDEFEFEVINK